MRFLAVAALAVPIVLAGCATTPTLQPSAVSGPSLAGRVHGGQQPLVGSQVYLFAASTTAYGGPAIRVGHGNASISLLQATADTQLDNSGDATNGDYYVTTNSNGGFSIASSDYSCTPGQQVYVYAAGGNSGYPSVLNNASASLLAVLGTCPSAGNFIGAVPFINIDEVTTVAAAYAIAGFASDALHVGDDEGVSGNPYATLAQTGMANAFANASNLADLGSGTALATTPSGNGTVPQQLINTLANILAACINTDGTVSGPTNATNCYTLFQNAQSAGTSGTVPSETATAAINIAHNPGANVTALFGLPSAQAPFGNTLATQPNDFTVGISFTGAGLNGPVGVAIDALGDAWVANDSYGSGVSELSPLGAPISPSTGYSGGCVVSETTGLAIDASGNVWVYSGNCLSKFDSSGNEQTTGLTNGELIPSTSIAVDGSGHIWIANSGFFSGASISEFDSSGNAISGSSGFTGGSLSGFAAMVSGLAVDGAGNVWVADMGSDAVDEFSFTNSGSTLSNVSSYTGAGLSETQDVAIDGYGNVWVANYGGSSVSELNNSGGPITGSSGYTGGTNGARAVAIDGAGNAWVGSVNGNTVAEISTGGTVLSGANGYTAGGISYPNSIAVDGSGDVWVAGQPLTEIIGAGVPVITPIAAGLPSTPTVDGSSSLGTRP